MEEEGLRLLKTKQFGLFRIKTRSTLVANQGLLENGLLASRAKVLTIKMWHAGYGYQGNDGKEKSADCPKETI